MRARARTWLLALACATTAASMSACGSSGNGGGKGGSGREVTVYSSLPEQGASKDTIKSVENSIRLAFSQSGYGANGVKINYVPLDDSTAQAGGWDPQQTSANARRAIQDHSAIVYLAEYNSGAAAVSIPITNQAGLTQLSATNSYVGLTTDDPGSEPGEPAKYYPTGQRTFFRVAPRDSIQAAAGVTLMSDEGCKRVAVANDQDTYGAGIARGLAIVAKERGLDIVSNQGIQKDAPNFRSYAQSLAQNRVDCFYFAGVTANGAVQLTKDVAAALPHAKLYTSDGSCEPAYLDASKGGLPTTVAKRVECTVATRDLQSYPGGKAYLKAYETAYGDAPDLWAIYWYDAARLVVDTIAAGGTDRQSFREVLAKTKDRRSVLGTYSFDKNGDSTLDVFAVYALGPKGDPVYVKTVRGSTR